MNRRAFLAGAVASPLLMLARKSQAGGMIINSYHHGAPFTPTDLSGCKLWLRADGVTGASDLDPLSTWEDESGENKDATVPGGNSPPAYRTGILNGRPVVKFGGTDCTLRCLPALSGSYTVYLVAKADVLSGYTLLGATDTNGSAFGFDAFSNHFYFAGSFTILGINWKDTSWHIYTFKVASGTGTIYRESDVFSGSTDAAFANLNLGASPSAGVYSEVSIAEIIAYESAHGDSDRSKVKGYLAAKYALP